MPADTELHKAARDGDKELAEDLLRGGADVNAIGAQGRTALHRALGGGFVEMCRYLIDNKAEVSVVDALKRTSLHWAAMAPVNGKECCELLFEVAEEAVVGMLDKQTKSGSTPLHLAAGSNRPEAVSLLLSKGADIKIKDDDDRTAHEAAKAEGHAAVLDVFREVYGTKASPGGGDAKSGSSACIVQ